METLYYTAWMEVYLIKRKICALEGCKEIINIPIHSRSRRKYCTNSHRKYAWKKRNWIRYLEWQKEYLSHKKRP